MGAGPGGEFSADGLQGFTYGFMTIREDGKPDTRAQVSRLLGQAPRRLAGRGL